MKRTKKILATLVLLALTVSLVAVISVAASAKYDGELDVVKGKLEGVVLGPEDAGESLLHSVSDQTILLTEIYQYLQDTPVNPAAEGYSDFESQYNTATFRVAYVLYSKYNEAAEANKEAALIELLKHLAGAPILNAEQNADFEIVIGHKCSGCSKEIALKTDNMIKVKTASSKANNIFTYSGINENLSRPSGCTDGGDLVAITYKYSDFQILTDALNFVAYSKLDTLVAKLFDTAEEGSINYYEYLSSVKAVKSILDSAKEIKYEETYNSKLYTGDLDKFISKVEKLDEKKSLEVLAEGLADIYTYLKETPVNPTTDKYYEVYVRYEELCDVLVEKCIERIDAAPADTYVDGNAEAIADGSKLAILMQMRAYLTEMPLTEKIVNAYNEKRQSLIQDYTDFYDFITSEENLSPLAPVVDANVQEFTAKLEALEAAETLDARKAAFTDLHIFVTANDISASETELLARYKTERNSLADDLMATVNNAVSISDKVVALEAVRTYLAVTPISKNTVDRYNDIREDTIALCTNFIDYVNAEGFIPVYEALAEPVITANEAAMMSFLEALEVALDAYDAATSENKAAALENAKNAAKSTYKYLKACMPDTTAGYYADFRSRYSAARTELVSAMILTAETANTEAAFASVRDYLNEYPLSKDLVDAYNLKVDEVFASDETLRNSLKASCVYHRIDAAAANINNTATKEALYSNMKLLSDYYRLKLDITDEAYNTFKTQTYVNAETAFVTALTAKINAKISTEDITAELTELSAFLKSTCVSEDAIEGFCGGVFDAKVSDYTAKLGILTGNSAVTVAISTDYDEVMALIDEFNRADGYEAKKDAFTLLYNKISAIEPIVITNTDEDYVALMETYSSACSAMETQLIEYIESFATPAELVAAVNDVKSYITGVKFSNGAVERYNAKLDEIRTIGYDSEKTRLETVATVLDYSPATTLTVDFTLLNTYLSDSVDAAKLSHAYHLLADGEKTTVGETDTYKAFDFGSVQYSALLENFNSGKTAVMDAFGTELEGASDKKEKLLEIEAYFTKDGSDAADKANIFSLSMVGVYNGMRRETLMPLVEEFTDKHDIYKPILDKVDTYLQVTDKDALTDAQKARFAEIVDTYRPAFRYAYIEGELIAIDNIVKVQNVYTDNSETPETESLISDLSLIYKNTAMDKLEYYITKNIEKNSAYKNFDERNFVNALYKEAFIEILDMIESLSGADKTAEIDRWTQYAADNCLPEELVTLFNERFSTAITPTAPAATASKGTVIDFFSAYNTFKASATLEDMKTEFASLTQYLNANPIPKNKTYDVYFAASSGSSGDFEDGGNTEEKSTPITEMKLELATLLKEQKEALEAQTPLSQYELGYETDTSGSLRTTNKGKFYYDGKKAYTYSLYSGGTNTTVKDTGGYTTVQGGNGGGYFNVQASSNNDSIVYEFDLMFNENNGAAQGFMLSSNTQYFNVNNYKMDSSGVFSLLPKGEDAIEFVPGAWKHIILIINTEEKTMELLVDYISVGKVYRSTLIRPDVYDYYNDYSRATTFIRLNCMNSNKDIVYDNNFCYDNLELYDGTGYREVDRFTSMRDTKKFETYVDYFTNESYEAPDRLYAYYQAKELYDTVKNTSSASFKKYLEKYENFDYVAKIESPARAYHMNKIRTMHEVIAANPITTSNSAAQQTRITELQTYVENNLIYLDAGDAELMVIRNALVDYQKQVNLTSYVDDLALAISRFYRAPTLVAMKRHLESIEKYMELTEVSDAENEERMLNDTAIISVINPMKGDAVIKELLNEEPLTITFIYNVYVPWKLAEQTKKENSEKIVDCMSFIESIVDDKTLSGEAYETALVNKAIEDANYDFVESYMAIIRRIRTSGEYVAETEGVERALRLADLIDAKFYVNLQTKHLAVLKEYIEKYSLTNSYIERLGVCMYLESYIAENDIDFTNPEALLYKNTLATYQNEVEQYLVDYEKLLKSNTVAFVGIVKEMGTYVDYADIKPLYDKALNNYYYAMNTDTEEAKQAVIIFNEYGEKLKALEENGAMFVGYSKNLTSKRQAQKYRALVNCAKCIEIGIDEGVSGVKKAMETYNEALAEYNASIGAVNGEISEISDVVSAVRSNSIASTVLAIIKGFFSK